MAFTPNSEVHLLNVPLENDYKNQIYFSDKNSQSSYFYSKKKYTFNNLSYQRKDNFIRVPMHIDSLYNCNYVMYKNNDYTSRWFYAFITKMEYINDGTTHVYIETDVYQTWLFDVTIKKSFVEREHVMDDTIGKHTFPEGLETGEFVVNNTIGSNFGSCHPVMAVTYDLKNKKNLSSSINGVFHGVGYLLIGDSQGVKRTLEYIIGAYETAGKIDAITGIFMVPDRMTNYTNIQWDYFNDASGLSYWPYKLLDSEILGDGPTSLGDVVMYKEDSQINGYTPKNKKLFIGDYNYLMCSNNNGSNAIYKYEYFSANPFSFKINGALTPGCSIKGYPRLYKGTNDNYDEGLVCGKFPVCSFNTDMYTNWLTQNSINIGGVTVNSDQMNIATSGLNALMQVAGGIGLTATGGGAMAGVGMVASGLTSGVVGVTNALMQQKQHEMVPPQARGNLNCGDVNFAMGVNDYMFYKMSIKREYAEKIDNYFEMFGYKINQSKVPNLNGRPYWNYVKTIDINIDGAIPNEDMQKLKAMYNNGVTLWKDGNVGDYSRNNH